MDRLGHFLVYESGCDLLASKCVVYAHAHVVCEVVDNAGG